MLMKYIHMKYPKYSKINKKVMLPHYLHIHGTNKLTLILTLNGISSITIYILNILLLYTFQFKYYEHHFNFRTQALQT